MIPTALFNLLPNDFTALINTKLASESAVFIELIEIKDIGIMRLAFAISETDRVGRGR